MNINDYIKIHQSNKKKKISFVEYLYSLMDERKIIKSSDLYNKAFVSKQTFSNIISNNVNPSLNTCIKLALALQLSNDECKLLLKKAGYTLASQSTFNLIIRYCFENKIYELVEVNRYLKEFGYEPIELS